MNTLVNTLYTASFTAWLLSIGLLRGRPTAAGRTSRWLHAFLLAESAAFGCELLMAHPATPLKGLWLGLRLGGALFIAPCLWLAVRETTEGVPLRFRDLGRAHLAAIGIGISLTLPLILDANLGPTYVDLAHPVSWWHARLIHATMLGCIGIFAIQAPVLLRRCHQVLVVRAVAADRAWLQIALWVVASTWAFGVLRTVQCAAHLPQELSLMFAAIEAGVAVVAIYFLLRRAGGPAGAASFGRSIAPPAASAGSSPATKYTRSCLPDSLRSRVRTKIEATLARPEVLGDSLLSLRSLGRHLNEKPHYVSQVISQDLRTNFYELISRLRIERAKRLLQESSERGILEIALEVGFNSKSTFNAAFRRVTGCTPTEFRRSFRDFRSE
jgi:AraC-like DNA-binding protein